DRVVGEPVPGTPQHPVLDRALTQRPALVRTPVVQRSETAVPTAQRDGVRAGVHRGDLPVIESAGTEHPDPAARSGVLLRTGARDTLHIGAPRICHGRSPTSLFVPGHTGPRCRGAQGPASVRPHTPTS